MSSRSAFDRVDLLLVSARSENGASLRESLCELDSETSGTQKAFLK